LLHFIQSNLDDKLKSNPNLLFDMLGASEKIALLGRQNEALLHSTQMLEEENAELRDELMKCRADLQAVKAAVGNGPMRRGSGTGGLTSLSNTPSRSRTMSKDVTSSNMAEHFVVATAVPATATASALSTNDGISSAIPVDISKRLAADPNDGDLEIEDESEISTSSPTDDTYLHRTHILISAREGEDRLCLLMKQREKERNVVGEKVETAQEGIDKVQEQLQQLLAEKNKAQRAQLSAGKDGGDGNSGGSQMEVILNKIRKQHEELLAHKQTMNCVQLELAAFDTNSAAVATELSGLRQIILYMTKLLADGSKSHATATATATVTGDDETEREGGSGGVGGLTLVPDVDAQWAMKDLNQQNAALADELRRVKMRFTSVLGKMEAFSMSKFRSAPTSEEHSTDDVDAVAVGGNSSGSVAQSRAKVWQSDVSGAVKDWSRQGRRDVSFIVTVRIVGADIRDWTLLKSFADFKTFRAKLKPFAGIALLVKECDRAWLCRTSPTHFQQVINKLFGCA
jgi:hypothetical protein